MEQIDPPTQKQLNYLSYLAGVRRHYIYSWIAKYYNITRKAAEKRTTKQDVAKLIGELIGELKK